MLPQTIICIGRSGSGKGTQIKLLEEYFKQQDANAQMIHIETGVYFRSFIEEKTVSGNLAKQAYLEGRREPEFLAISMWGYILCKDYTAEEHIMFDGAPRSLTEAKIIEDALSFYNRFDETLFVKPKIVFLDVSHDWSVARMHERGRVDDQTKEQLELRSHWFETEVMQAVEYFKANPRFDFVQIPGEGSIEEVQALIRSHLPA
ncbi:MAG: nucleoside monophosphate kinase [Patescibacteria group bacterium]